MLLNMLVNRSRAGIVMVFYYNYTLDLDRLVSYHSASFPTGTIIILDNNTALDTFTSFVAGFAITKEEP